MDEGQLLMTQAERDRLVALQKAKQRPIAQRQVAEEIGVTERQVRRLLRQLRRKGGPSGHPWSCGGDYRIAGCPPRWNNERW